MHAAATAQQLSASVIEIRKGVMSDIGIFLLQRDFVNSLRSLNLTIAVAALCLWKPVSELKPREVISQYRGMYDSHAVYFQLV